LPKLEQYIWVF